MKNRPVLTAAHLRCEAQGALLFDMGALNIGHGVTLIQGGEGSGKTTLLRVLAGEVTLPGCQLQRVHGSNVFWADPRSAAHDQTTVSDYFESQRTHYPQWSADLQNDLTQALGLAAHVDKPLYMLSTGSKRKVWLCAAFSSGATLTLLDEPFAALDASSIATVLDILTEAAEHPLRAWVLADYLPPRGISLAQTILLGQET